MWSPEDGAYTEGISYNFWGGNQIAQFLELLSRLEGVNYFQQEAVKNRFTKLFDWLAYEVLPQPRNLYNYFNDLNESYTFDMAKISTVMMFAAHYPDKASLASWIFANTAQNVDNLLPSVDQYQTRSGDGHSMLFILPLLTYNDVPPVDPSTLLQLSKYFYRDGLVYVRTSSSLWADQNDIQLAFTSSPAIDPVSQYFSIKHDHADKNHFTLSAYGVQYLVDAGAGDQYNATWQSQYHNIVLIDNVGEAEGGWYERDGRIASYSKSPLFETMHGDARLAYNQLHYENGGVHLIATDQSSTSYRLNPVLNADRYVNFIRADASLPAYIVIADDINKDNGSHRYDWLIHTYQSEGPGNPLTLNAGNGNYLNI